MGYYPKSHDTAPYFLNDLNEETPIMNKEATARDARAGLWRWTEEVRKLLQAGETVEFTPKGLSMWPTLRPKTDTVCVRPTAEYARMDIVLAATEGPAGVVLHRVMRKEGGTYTLMGDANLYQTETCTEQEILGKVVTIRRNGKNVTAGTANRLLRRVHASSPALRRTMVRIMNLIRR